MDAFFACVTQLSSAYTSLNAAREASDGILEIINGYKMKRAVSKDRFGRKGRFKGHENFFTKMRDVSS